IGWSQISGDLQAPCGYDSFSYSFRDSPGTLFHQSKKIDADNKYLEGYGEGDTLGMTIFIPSHEDILPSLYSRLWDMEEAYVPFKANPMKKMPGSEISYYKNGVKLGVAFTDLYIGKYYPAISSYMGGSATINFGPKFKFLVPEGSRPYFEIESLPTWGELMDQRIIKKGPRTEITADEDDERIDDDLMD
ncbi:Set1/Ash2 histone methyltransferase complex subunit ASH2, partial [Nowakowskiella sp. JEL0078]